jgi:hypothetical protein
MMLKLRSAIHRVFFELRQRRKWSRQDYREEPVEKIDGLSFLALQRLAALSEKYGVRFESLFAREAALENYFTLDLLAQAQERLGFHPQGGVLADIGSRSFAYATALQTFFQPKQVSGVELDAFPLFETLHTRYSHAQFYIKNLPSARYLALDFLDFKESCNGLTLFYPFVTEQAHVAWRLPLKRFRPTTFFAHAATVLKPGGWLFMVNHGQDERRISSALAAQAGLICRGEFVVNEPILQRLEPPVVSVYDKPFA